MTTNIDQARAGRAQANRQGNQTTPESIGVSDLVILALSELANGPVRTEASEDTMRDLPVPHVTAMARLMADPDSDEAEVLVTDLLEAGVSVRDLCLSHIAPAARELGRLWQCDLLPFAEVTIATARMQTILHSLPGAPRTNLCHPHRAALFAATPGETHTLGVVMAVDHFRRLGWDVGVLLGQEHDALVRQIIADARPVVGLSCAGGHSLDALKRLIDDIQARRPDVAIVVSGSITSEPEAIAMLPDFDGISETLETAELDVEEALAFARCRNLQAAAAAMRYERAAAS